MKYLTWTQSAVLIVVSVCLAFSGRTISSLRSEREELRSELKRADRPVGAKRLDLPNHPVVVMDSDGWYWADQRQRWGQQACSECHGDTWSCSSGWAVTDRMEWVGTDGVLRPRNPGRVTHEVAFTEGRSD